MRTHVCACVRVRACACVRVCLLVRVRARVCRMHVNQVYNGRADVTT